MKNPKQPIYPTVVVERTRFATMPTMEVQYNGLTKREYFAAMAMQGYLAKTGTGFKNEQLADWCIQIADELLKQLET